MAFARGDGALWQARGRQLQSHVDVLTAWEFGTMFGVESPMLVTRVLVICGWLLYDMRADAKLFVLMNKLLAHLGSDRLTVEKR
jgi:hypothetical protein